MIFIWNRKEIYSGTSIERFSEVGKILSENKIDYKYRVVNRNFLESMDPFKAPIGTFGENLDYIYTYYIYVNKQNYDLSCNLIYK